MNDVVYARVTRRFGVLPERVFDAWLDPEMIGQWMFGPRLREEEVVNLTADARVGGTFSFVVRRQGEEIDHIGEYREIDRPRRLVFTWAVAPEPIDSSLVTIDILPSDRGCELKLTHEMSSEWADYVSRTEDAWTLMLNALDGVL